MLHLYNGGLDLGVQGSVTASRARMQGAFLSGHQIGGSLFPCLVGGLAKIGGGLILLGIS